MATRHNPVSKEGTPHMSTRMGQWLISTLAGCGIAACLLVGCTPPPHEPTKVGVNPWVGYDPLVLARESGLLDPREVQVVELASASESKRALRSGLLDAATLTLDEAIRLADGGLAVQVVAVLDVSHGADTLLVRPGITSLPQLRGQRLAFEDTSLGNLMLDGVLQAADLTHAEVSTFHVEASQHVDVLNSGRADAVITYEPMKSLLLSKGMVPLFDSTDLPGRILDVLVTRADLPVERAAAIVLGWERGRRALQEDPVRGAQQLAPGVDLSTDQYLATLEGLRFFPLADSQTLLNGQPAPLAALAAPATDTLRRLGLLGAPPNWGALINPQPGLLALRTLAQQDKRP